MINPVYKDITVLIGEMMSRRSTATTKTRARNNRSRRATVAGGEDPARVVSQTDQDLNDKLLNSLPPMALWSVLISLISPILYLYEKLPASTVWFRQNRIEVDGIIKSLRKTIKQIEATLAEGKLPSMRLGEKLHSDAYSLYEGVGTLSREIDDDPDDVVAPKDYGRRERIIAEVSGIIDAVHYIVAASLIEPILTTKARQAFREYVRAGPALYRGMVDCEQEMTDLLSFAVRDAYRLASERIRSSSWSEIGGSWEDHVLATLRREQVFQWCWFRYGLAKRKDDRENWERLFSLLAETNQAELFLSLGGIENIIDAEDPNEIANIFFYSRQ